MLASTTLLIITSKNEILLLSYRITAMRNWIKFTKLSFSLLKYKVEKQIIHECELKNILKTRVSKVGIKNRIRSNTLHVIFFQTWCHHNVSSIFV